MAIIVMFHKASGKKKTRMASYLTSWNLSRASRSTDQADHQKSTERTGQSLSSGGLIQKIYEVDSLICQNVRRKIVPLFLSEFPYVVVPLVLQRIQYYAMIAENSKAGKLMTAKRNLE